LGKIILPPYGMDLLDLDQIQREITGDCKSKISPEYLPHLYIEKYQDKTILVIWAPAGDNRPYESPRRDKPGKAYWVRSGSSTIEAEGDIKRQLIELAAKIPYDDRRNLTTSIEDISSILVKKFLNDIRSHLSLIDIPSIDVYRKLRLTVPVNDHEIPRNFSLLFFNEDPGRFFPGSHIEVVQFGDDAGGNLIEEKEFRGPLPDQIHACLNYLNGFGGSLIRKIEGQAEVERTVPYPYEAMEEVIVNAVYHRSYESLEPIKVYLFPDRMEITSYPGPVPGIKMEHLKEGKTPAVPARNRRIGELLKDLRLAEMRGSGIPKIQRKMLENGSPKPQFDFDEDSRTYFRVVLPVHPRFQVIHSIREAAHLWAIGEKNNAIALLERAFSRQPNSGALASQLIEYYFGFDNPSFAYKVINTFEKEHNKGEINLPYLTMAKMLIDNNKPRESTEFLRKIIPSQNIRDIIEAAILRKRMHDYKGAHELFKKASEINPNDPKMLLDFAQTKIYLAKGLYGRGEHLSKKRLNKEAVELLRRAIQLSPEEYKFTSSWCWFELARALEWLREPHSDVEAALLKSRSLLPEEPKFIEYYDRWKEKQKNQIN
jgi:ATP-dependent DNA helicase RecG